MHLYIYRERAPWPGRARAKNVDNAAFMSCKCQRSPYPHSSTQLILYLSLCRAFECQHGLISHTQPHDPNSQSPSPAVKVIQNVWMFFFLCPMHDSGCAQHLIRSAPAPSVRSDTCVAGLQGDSKSIFFLFLFSVFPCAVFLFPQ